MPWQLSEICLSTKISETEKNKIKLKLYRKIFNQM